MTEAQLLVNGLISASSLSDARRLLREPDHWIAAYPHGSGLPTGKVRPLRQQYAPVTLQKLELLGVIPYVANNNDTLAHGSRATFAFAALLTLASTESLAIQYAVQNVTWLEPKLRNTFDGIVWSSPDRPGSFAHLCEGD